MGSSPKTKVKKKSPFLPRERQSLVINRAKSLLLLLILICEALEKRENQEDLTAPEGPLAYLGVKTVQAMGGS
jgi:hypothetical protein